MAAYQSLQRHSLIIMYLQNFFLPSTTPGTSKGYGLVKYESKASSIQARHVLEGHQVRDGHILDCDWLKHNRSPQAGSNPAPPTVTSLHSKCLYVDQLPPDYRDMAQFRRLFSKIVNPPYCQVRDIRIAHFVPTFPSLYYYCCKLLELFAAEVMMMLPPWPLLLIPMVHCIVR